MTADDQTASVHGSLRSSDQATDGNRQHIRFTGLEAEKAVTLVRHIEAHLKPGQVVICKICGKDIHSIYVEEAEA